TRRFDDCGRLAGETLPDGHAIGYGYLANGALSAVAVRTPARRLQVIASAIEWIPFAAPGSGLTGFVFGNSIRAAYRHDRFGRIVEVDHQRPGAAPVADGLPRQHIRYDERGLITSIDEPARRFGYAHDAAGRLTAAASAGTAADDSSFDYEGFGYDDDGRRRITVAGGGRWSPDGQTMLRTVSQAVHRYDAGGALAAEAAGAAGADAGRARSPSLHAFNHAGERVRSTPADGDQRPRYFIHHDGQLAAEIDADGRLLNGYVRIGGRPVATLRSGPTGDTILYLHSDHIGTHRAATDQRASVVQALSYTAFGKPTSHGIEPRGDGPLPDRTAPSPRRLGQFADPGDPLHYNQRRWYDPRKGRFTTPDPLGVLAGHDAYAYAAHDPIRLTDPSGLYETDIHFYMMYFLARVSGLSEPTSLTIAQASQFVDDNPATEPLPNASLTTLPQPQRLASYHITQDGRDPPRRPGESDIDYAMRRILDPVNPQLTLLLAHANRNLQTAATPGGSSPCTRAQLFGEYLHVFADTFAHRNNRNEPIPLYGGLGHALYGSSPDFTFNHVALHQFLPAPYPPTPAVYQLNEYRTLQMERAVMNEIARNFGTEAVGPDGLPLRFEDVEPVLQRFNALRESGECGNQSCWAGKIALLEGALSDLGLGQLPRYSADEARNARIRNLQGLNQSEYPGAVLTTK
nr:RHS repeat-associated core domain-containing protein [Burkholderiaceae bacterium]